MSSEELRDLPEALPVLNNWVRGALVGIVLGLTAVFATAIWLRPYQQDGSARRMETHRQLGLPPCSFYFTTGQPCPACGMTTSFSLLLHGDVLGSMRANWVGTLLALFCLAFIPWALVSVARRQPVFVRSLEKSLMVVIISLLVLMLSRWGVNMGVAWYNGAPVRFW
jgi:hypothetical protein